MSVSSDSRYNYTPVVQILDPSGALSEKLHLDIRPTLQTIIHSDNIQFTPSDTDNWSRIAWRYLGNGKLYWIIADYSQVIDPFTELKARTRTRYLTQLAASVAGGATVTTLTMLSTKNIRRGDTLKVEDLNPANLTSMNVVVMSVDDSSKVVSVSPVTAPVTGIANVYSRVSRVYKEQVRLTIPSAHNAFFEALDFGNPLNVLVE